jgi:negative regulator of replication initiation
MRQIEIDLEVHRRIEAERCSFDESENAILRRLLDIEDGEAARNSGSKDVETRPRSSLPIETAIPIGSRTTGNWSVEWNGQRFMARNLREAYLTGLARLAEHDETLFDKLAKEGSGRRRYVAGRPQDLYPNSPHLAKPERNNSHRLGKWHVDLNLSRDQASKRIRRAAALAGVRYGQEIAIRDGLRSL